MMYLGRQKRFKTDSVRSSSSVSSDDFTMEIMENNCLLDETDHIVDHTENEHDQLVASAARIHELDEELFYQETKTTTTITTTANLQNRRRGYIMKMKTFSVPNTWHNQTTIKSTNLNSRKQLSPMLVYREKLVNESVDSSELEETQIHVADPHVSEILDESRLRRDVVDLNNNNIDDDCQENSKKSPQEIIESHNLSHSQKYNQQQQQQNKSHNADALRKVGHSLSQLASDFKRLVDIASSSIDLISLLNCLVS